MSAEQARELFAAVARVVLDHLHGTRLAGELCVSRDEAIQAIRGHERRLEIEAAHEATEEANRG